MKRFRVSIAALMGWVVIIATGIFLLKYASEGWAMVAELITYAVLTASILGIIYRAKEKRAFWLGFLLFGWGYQTLWLWDAHVIGSGTSELLGQMSPFMDNDHGLRDGGSFFGGLMIGSDQKTRRIWKKLDLPISMPFANETPIEDVLKYVHSATSDSEMPSGIPIYVDPVGLQEAEKTLVSPITLSVEGVSLRKTLKLVLDQLDLCYLVQDGLLTITSKASRGETLNSFVRVGQCEFTLLAALLGGLAGRLFHATRGDSSDPRPLTT